MGNTFGRLFRVTTFGESHGKAIGGIIDGCPSGYTFSMHAITEALRARRPNPMLHGNVSTQRVEEDPICFLSGIHHNNDDTMETLGTPIAFSINNTNIRKEDYTTQVFRPGHADYTYYKKFGIQEVTGGGRASGRETVARVVAGAIANIILNTHGINVYAGTEAIHGIHGTSFNYTQAHQKPFYALDVTCIPTWQTLLQEIRTQGDSVGGIVRLIACGVPVGLGEPVFDKIDARLAYALMSVGAVKGIEIGAGFTCAQYTGSVNNDPIGPFPSHNNAGGILGGITTGDDITMRVAVKAIPSIAKEQYTTTHDGKETTITTQGRHDVCAIPRIVPVLASMVQITLVDFLLLHHARYR